MKAYIVDRKALAENIIKLREKAGSVAVYGVIKGNGYGLGLIPMAEILRENGVCRFAVTEPEDVSALRRAGFLDEEILMLRATCIPSELDSLIRDDAVLTISDMDCAQAISTAAQSAGKNARCHIKVDTGMGRYGFHPGETDSAAAVFKLPGIEISGIYTHFHSAFCNEAETKKQFSDFTAFCARLTELGLDPGLRHCCNSSAFVRHPEMYLDGVRLGSALLGRLSCEDPIGLNRIGWCESCVEQKHTLPAGHGVGYGAPWHAGRPTVTAVCGVGYYNGFDAGIADDIFRFRDCVRMGLGALRSFLTKKAIYVTVNGKPARVLGHIGMVQTIVDVTDIPCAPGDPVRLEINPLRVKGMEVVFR